MKSRTFFHLLLSLMVAATSLPLWERTVLAAELYVSAAASLTGVCAVFKAEYEKRNPGITVLLNMNASGLLLRQMEQGAPADVFISADEETMDQAVSRNAVVAATRRVVAGNSLVLAIPPSGSVAALEALEAPGVARIAMGNPESVPAGRYAREALMEAGLYETLKPKLILAENVRQALDYLSRGEVDAAFVFATDARKAGDKVKVALTLATKRVVTYPAAVAAGAKNPEAAKGFLAFLSSPEAWAIFTSNGFTTP
jgi:molybdate transport system substrate-binding protein